jgi:SAM-dependent methyltransferase
MTGISEDEYGAATYGDRYADRYDELHHGIAVPTGSLESCVDTLARLAGTGPVLELGIGTGRVALPLAEAGVEVHGLDASQAMVDQLRAKPGGDELPVTIGDFSAFDLGRTFPLVYLVFNTLFVLNTQEQQLACFDAVARHLEPGGRFVIEAFVPDLGRFDRGQRTQVRTVGLDHVWMELSVHDVATQRVDTQQIRIDDGGRTELRPIAMRYAWPAELDLMARLAGLVRAERWQDWSGTPFTSTSGFHITVYERPAA